MSCQAGFRFLPLEKFEFLECGSHQTKYYYIFIFLFLFNKISFLYLFSYSLNFSDDSSNFKLHFSLISNCVANFSLIRVTGASRWRAIAYPRASAIAYLLAHRNSKCFSPVLIHRAITCDSFKALARKAWEELCDNKKRTPNPTFGPLVTPSHAAGAIFFAPLYSTLHYL